MRKILSVLLICLLLVCSVSPTFAAQDKTVRNFTELKTAVASIGEDESAVIKIANDIAFEEAIIVDSPCKITFCGPATFSVKGNETRAFYVGSDDVKLFFENITITNTKGTDAADFADDGRYIYINGENCVINGAVFKNDADSAADAGGAICVNAGYCSVEKCTFEGCKAGKEGGAIFIDNDYVTVIDCTFTECSSAVSGGIICVDDYCTDSLVENCTFTTCSGLLVNGWNTLVVNCVPDTTDESLFYGCEFADSSDWLFGSILSCGSIWIVIAILVIAAIAVICITRNRHKASAE